MDDVVLLIMLIVFVTLLVSKYIITLNNTEFLSIKQTGSLKGLAILMVYIHHFGQIRYSIYNSHSFLGFLGVALFLFISGYVTQRQVELKKEKWKRNFWIKKFQRLFVPRCVVVFVFGMLAGRTLLVSCQEAVWFIQDWFFAAVVFNYIIFYVSEYFRLKTEYIIFIAEALFAAVCILFGQQIMWYNTAFLFGMGVVFAKYQDTIMMRMSRIANKTWVIIPILLFCFSILGSIFRWQRFVSDSISGILFVFIIIWGAYRKKVTFKGLEFIGKYSWEFYLVHTRVIGIILNRVTSNDLFAFFISLIVSLAIAILLNETLSFFYKTINKRLPITHCK
ncbi:acyltransferase [Drancourtella massiliensis]|uniref:Acyltransferase n=1 Tax=Drancourtella massiliensis TaxID=1632013 RepID=A0ABS2EHF6_9FIRM|nr:acyltransferase family protein [Drancourtella massiliensis]MBM6744341.1 acyltransferase [Drancourtella massiliensis]